MFTISKLKPSDSITLQLEVLQSPLSPIHARWVTTLTILGCLSRQDPKSTTTTPSHARKLNQSGWRKTYDCVIYSVRPAYAINPVNLISTTSTASGRSCYFSEHGHVYLFDMSNQRSTARPIPSRSNRIESNRRLRDKPPPACVLLFTRLTALPSVSRSFVRSKHPPCLGN